MKTRHVIKRSCLVAAIAGAAIVGTTALAAPPQSSLSTSIHRNARAAVAQIHAQFEPNLSIPKPARVRPSTADAALSRSIAARGREALTAIQRTQGVEIKARSATLLTVVMRESQPRHTREVALWQRTLNAENSRMLEIIRSFAENAAFRWIPEASWRTAAPNDFGVRQ